MENENPEGNLGKDGPLPQDQTGGHPQPSAVVYVHDLEHGKELMGFHRPGQHRLEYREMDGDQSLNS